MLFTTIDEILTNKTFCLEKVEKLKTFIEFETNGFTETTPIALSTVLKSNGLNDTYWVLNLSKKGCYVLKAYAIWNAEKVLRIWEKQYPNDKRPRLAIEAAKKALEDLSEENKKATAASFSNAAAYAADYAADAVAYADYVDTDARAAVAAADAADYAAYADYAYTDARAARAAVAVAVADARADAVAAADVAHAAAVAAFKKEQEAELTRLIEEAS